MNEPQRLPENVLIKIADQLRRIAEENGFELAAMIAFDPKTGCHFVHVCKTDALNVQFTQLVMDHGDCFTTALSEADEAWTRANNGDPQDMN